MRHDPMQVMQRGMISLRNKNYDEALVDLLWCWDHGAIHNPNYSAVRVSFLVGFLVDLAGQYPPAKLELCARLDSLQKLRDADSASLTQLDDLAALERELSAKE